MNAISSMLSSAWLSKLVDFKEIIARSKPVIFMKLHLMKAMYFTYPVFGGIKYNRLTLQASP